MLDNFFSTKPIDTLLSEPDTLAVLAFRQDSDGKAVPAKLSTLVDTHVEPDYGCDYEPEDVFEVWKTDTDIIDSGSTTNCRWRCSEDYLFVAVDLVCESSHDLEDIAEQAYQGILRTIQDSNHPNLLRFWNILPRINVGDGDDENYKRFCTGRLNAFRQLNIKDSDYPAATAVGHYGNGLTVYAISTKLTPVHFGNPRQVHAFEYPREYGPSSPSFARATSLESPGHERKKLLCVSGTASILGHETVHIDDLAEQLKTTNANILYLVKGAGLEGKDIRSLRVYLRHPADVGLVRKTVRAWYPDAQIVITHADICRANLRVEIECFCVRA